MKLKTFLFQELNRFIRKDINGCRKFYKHHEKRLP